MFRLIVDIIGILSAAVYVGYMVYKIGEVPLWIIVLGTFALMIREFIVEYRTNADRPAEGPRAG